MKIKMLIYFILQLIQTYLIYCVVYLRETHLLSFSCVQKKKHFTSIAFYTCYIRVSKKKRLSSFLKLWKQLLRKKILIFCLYMMFIYPAETWCGFNNVTWTIEIYQIVKTYQQLMLKSNILFLFFSIKYLFINFWSIHCLRF